LLVEKHVGYNVDNDNLFGEIEENIFDTYTIRRGWR